MDPCKFNDLIIEAFGVDGKTGRVGALEKKMAKLENMQIKLMLIIVGSASVGGGAAAGIMKLFT